MGNEMGNSNTTGLQEEENSTTQAQEGFLQGGGQGDGAERKNPIVPVYEVKDFNEVHGLASDSLGLNQKSNGREQEETEVHHPDEDAKVDGESNEASDETSEIQQNFPYADSKEDKNPPGYVIDGQENPSVYGAEGKDYQGKENGFMDHHVLDQIPDETGQEETEIDPPAESPKVDLKPNNKADGETSEIQETSASKDIEDDAKAPSLIEDAEVKNGIVPLPECQDNNERRINELAFNVPEGAQDPHVANKISDEREQEGKGLDPPAEYPKVEIKPNNKSDGETGEIQETSPSKDRDDDAKPPSLVEDAEVENGIVPPAECQDNNQRGINGLAFSVPEGAEDPHVANKISDEREQEEKELDPPAESPKVEIKPNNKADGETNEIQETSPSKDTEDDVKPPSLGGETEVENGIVPLAECQDNNERGINELAFNVPEGAEDPHVANKISDESEQEDKELDPPDEYPNVEIKPNNKSDGETSEIQETSPSKDREDDLKPPSLVEDAEVENGIVPPAECQDNNQRGINGLAFSVPEGAEDPHVANKISDEREQKEKELDPPAESPKVEIQPNNKADGETNEIQETSPSKDTEDDVKPPSLVGETEVENGIIPLAECQDNNEKGVNELAFNVPEGAEDPHVANKISDEREQEDKELDPPAEFQKVEVKPNDETSDIQPTFPSIDSTHVETLQESILEENLPQLSDHRLLNQDSIKKGIEGEKNATFDTISSSEDPEPQESIDSIFDQPELTTIHADPPVEDSNNVAQSIEDILGSNSACTVEENCQHIGTNFPKDLVESVVFVSDSKVDKENDDLTVKEMASEAVSSQERMISNDRDEISNDLGQKEEMTSELSTGMRINCNGDLPTEMNQIRSDSPEAEVEAVSMDESLNSHMEMSASADECILLTEEAVLATNESEDGETKATHHPTYPIEESAEKCNIDKVNMSLSALSEGMMIESKPEINEKRTAEYASCVSRCNKDYSEEAKVVENDHPVEVHINNQSSMEPCKDSQKDNVVVPESRRFMEESYLTEFETKEVPEEKKINEETEETTRASCISDIKQEALHNKSFVTEASSFYPANLMTETLVSVDQLATEKSEQDLSQYAPETTATIEESNTQANHFIGQGEKIETPAFASDESKAQECMERLSTESNSNASNIQAQMQKSPSFGPDLRIEARTEEFHDAIEDFSTQADVSLGNGIASIEYGEDKHVYQAMPAEEKVITMERIDSDKSKTPFLGFLKEEEEAHILATPQEKDSNNSAKTTNKEFLNLPTKEVASTSPKSKEKRKPRSFLFANCVCCTTVIN